TSRPTRPSSDLFSVTARLRAAITSRPPSARTIRAPTISKNLRICVPPLARRLPLHLGQELSRADEPHEVITREHCEGPAAVPHPSSGFGDRRVGHDRRHIT